MTVPKIAVIYYSSTGSVHTLAHEYAAGAQEAGAETRVRRVAELAPPEAVASNPAWQQHHDVVSAEPIATVDDVLWADAIVFGTPTRFGNVVAQLKQFTSQTCAISSATQACRDAGAPIWHSPTDRVT